METLKHLPPAGRVGTEAQVCLITVRSLNSFKTLKVQSVFPNCTKINTRNRFLLFNA